MSEEEAECTCIPENAIILNVLNVVEYVSEDGELFKADFSHDAAGEELELSKVLELSSWARMIYEAPIMADIVSQLLSDDD